jgi:hypothetical protein
MKTKRDSKLQFTINSLGMNLFLVLIVLVFSGQANASWSKQAVKEMVALEAGRQNFSIPLALAVAEVESNFDPYARSHVDARGVMQIMPRTAELDLGVRATSLYNPRINIKAGVKFLKHLVKTYDGRVDIALSHYNGGSRVRSADGSLSIIPATRKYVEKVMVKANLYRAHPMAIKHDVTAHNSDQFALKSRSNFSLNNRANRASINALDDFSNGDPLSAYKAEFVFTPEVKLVTLNKRQDLVNKLKTLARHNQNRVIKAGTHTSVSTNTRYKNEENSRRELVRQWERL